MFRYLFLLPIIAFLVVGCLTSSGEAPEPALSVPVTASEAGIAAVSSEALDPKTCDGVLARPPGSHTLELQSLTETAQTDVQRIDSMCAAVYETSNPGDPFLTVALIQFDSAAPAITRYGLLRDVFLTQGLPISELNSADEALLDRFSALIDRDGIGRTTVMRLDNWVLTISIGPTIAASLWTTDDLQIIGESIIRRAQE